MNYFLNLTALTVLSIALTISAVLIFFVARHNPKSATNRIFVLLGLITSLWLVVMYATTEPVFFSHILLFTRLAVFFAVPQSVLFFLLAHTMPSDKLLIGKNSLILSISGAITVMLLTLSPYVFQNVQVVNSSQEQLIGPAMPIFAAFVSFFSLAAIYVLTQKFRKAKDVTKRQFLFILLGILLMLALIIGTIMLPVILFQNDTFVQFSPLYALIFLGATAYAIFKHHLFNIKILATEALAFLLVILTLFEALFSNSLGIFLFRISIFLLGLIFGIFLIKNVRLEVAQKEKLQKLSQDLAFANTELKRLDAAKSEFVSIASHQLRTPLTASKGYLSLVLEGTYGKLSAKMQKPIRNVYDSNQRLVHLVNDLLNLARIESGTIKLDPQQTNVTEIIRSVIAELKIKAEQKNLKLVFAEPKLPIHAIFVDKEKIRNVILNLIDNAIRYTQKGSITTKIQPMGKIMHISVTDTGQGMTTEEINKLFASFSRGNAGKELSTEGTGLGLYIARQFVGMHKGKIWAESPGKGKGSTFHIELPVR